ncbi:hypothetical protein [Bacillus massiliglaciei]|uniref:hypothetical protein n=1 Tax=Bacillus massiliglaciei TaxID=1816693 RepID=UPI0018FE0F98|nr:hypothetical protein [Bacillus massiliglaciei]
MVKLGWILTLAGALAIIGSILYPLDVISKTEVLYLLIGGAVLMFAGSMIRNFAVLRKK